MIFANATMLAGVAGAAVPLTLHLLSRARCRTVEWGAMMFLGVEDPRQHRGSHLKELILLLLRMSIVALLAITLSRPVLTPFTSGLQNESACLVILLDRSASMGVEENGPQRIDAARRAAQAALSSLRPGDEAALILMPDNQPPLLTTDLQSLVARVSDARPVPGRADIAATLNSAARVFEQSHSQNRQLVLICDRQAVSWRDVNDEFARNWRKSLPDQNGQTPLFSIVPVGGNDAGNVAIESLSIVNPPVIRGAMTTLEVRVRNYDTVPTISLPLTIMAGYRELYRTSLNLPAGAASTVRTTARFTAASSQILTARIGASGLSSDDTMDTAIEVTDPIGVLVVSGDWQEEPAGSFHSEADFVRLALAPFATSGQGGSDAARVQVVSSDNWPELDRAKHRVVILANVPRFSQRQVGQIEQYVYGGGGLLVAPGNLARTGDYNNQLWREGAGVLPAELESPVPADGSQSTALLGLELSHPIFRFLEGRQDPLPGVTIGRYFPVRAAEPPGRVIGRYTSGKPFIVERSYGRGRVLLITTSLGADWSTLPLSNFYLPLMQSAVRYLAVGMQPDRNLAPGEPIVVMIDNVTDPRVSIDGPLLPNAPVELLRTSAGYEARFANTARPGRYTIHIRSDRESRNISFVVRSPRDESDLTSLSPEQWDRLERSLGFSRIAAEPQTVASTIAESRRHQELWPIMLPGVILLSLVELGLARVWTIERGER